MRRVSYCRSVTDKVTGYGATDKVIVCLVCKKAYEAMIPSLYESVTVAIPQTFTGQPLSNLLRSSNPGPKHIRHLIVEKADTSDMLLPDLVAQATHAENAVFILLSVLPRDALRSLRYVRQLCMDHGAC